MKIEISNLRIWEKIFSILESKGKSHRRDFLNKWQYHVKQLQNGTLCNDFTTAGKGCKRIFMELIKQPSFAACGQACIAMITGKDINVLINNKGLPDPEIYLKKNSSFCIISI